ncbi:hypothetical protein ACQ4PT_029410 [Festuca glaucescens]
MQPRRSSNGSPFREPGVLTKAAARDGKRRRRHGSDGDSRASKKWAAGRDASPGAHISCARIRVSVHASPSKVKEETRVVSHDAEDMITKKNIGDSGSCKKIETAMPASPPKKGTSSATHVSIGDVRQGGIKKQNASEKTSCTRLRPAVAVQVSGLEHKMKVVGSASILCNDAHGVIKTKQEAGERVQATVMKRIAPPSHLASAMKVRSAGVVRNKAHGVIKMKQAASMSVQPTITKIIPQIGPPAPAGNHQDPSAPQDALRAALAVARQARERRQQNVYMQQQREEARRELDKVVRTVFFNDPYITLENSLKP